MCRLHSMSWRFQADVSVALGQDRQLLDGRPMFISRCEDRASGKRTHQFKVRLPMCSNLCLFVDPVT